MRSDLVSLVSNKLPNSIPRSDTYIPLQRPELEEKYQEKQVVLSMNLLPNDRIPVPLPYCSE